MTHDDCTMLTVSGRMVDLHTPHADMIDLDDIAHALSRVQRFGGHTVVPYSVLEHSLLVSMIVGLQHPQFQLHALLHDAAEAYIGDASRPLKNAMRSSVIPAACSDYDRIEAKLQAVIENKWSLNAAGNIWRDIVKDADQRAYLIELPTKLSAVHAEHRLWHWVKDLPPFAPEQQGYLERWMVDIAQHPMLLPSVFKRSVSDAIGMWHTHLAQLEQVA